MFNQLGYNLKYCKQLVTLVAVKCEFDSYLEVIFFLGQQSVRMEISKVRGCLTLLQAFFHASSRFGYENEV